MIRRFLMYWLAGVIVLTLNALLMWALILPPYLVAMGVKGAFFTSRSQEVTTTEPNLLIGAIMVIVALLYIPSAFAWLLSRTLQREDGVIRSIISKLMEPAG